MGGRFSVAEPRHPNRRPVGRDIALRTALEAIVAELTREDERAAVAKATTNPSSGETKPTARSATQLAKTTLMGKIQRLRHTAELLRLAAMRTRMDRVLRSTFDRTPGMASQ
jgi:hypothetical protein